MVCVTLYNRRIQHGPVGQGPTLRLPGLEQESTGMLLHNLFRKIGVAVRLLHIDPALPAYRSASTSAAPV